jgi:hypothetical protein
MRPLLLTQLEGVLERPLEARRIRRLVEETMPVPQDPGQPHPRAV